MVRLLIAHGDAASRLALERVAGELSGADLEVVQSAEGMETVEMLLAADAPAIAVVSWDLPGCDGPEVCRLVRAYRRAGLPYIILLARRDDPIAAGLDAGANDCVHTPARRDELQARISVGRRVAALPCNRVTEAGLREGHASSRGATAHLLDAQLVQDDVDPCGRSSADPGGGFELQSLLIAQ